MLKPIRFLVELGVRYALGAIGDAVFEGWLLEEIQGLGPVYVKIGQILATRNDLPPAMTAALEKLQDKAEGVPFDAIGVRLPSNVVVVEDEPIAAASLGIVYRGLWRDDGAAKDAPLQEVAIKVLRPNIRRELCEGLWGFPRLLRYVSDYFDEVSHVLDVCRQYRRSIYGELNYVREAKNFDRLAGSLSDDSLAAWNRVPCIYAASKSFIVMEYLPGARINDLGFLRGRGIDPACVADNLLEAFLHQCLMSDMFHSDCHAGNIAIAVDNKKGGASAPYLIWYDCGAVVNCTPEWQDNLVRLSFAFLKADTASIVRALGDMGIIRVGRTASRAVTRFLRLILAADVSVYDDDPSALVRTVLAAFDADPVWKEDLRQAFVSNSSYVILGKTIIVINQICTTLDPTFNFIQRSMVVVKRFWNTNHSTTIERLDIFSEVTTIAKNITTMPSKVSMLEAQVSDMHDDMNARLQASVSTVTKQVLFAQVCLLALLKVADFFQL